LLNIGRIWHGFLFFLKSETMTHGGSRKGSGRKPNEDGQGRSVPKSIKVSQEVADYLSETGPGIIEDLVRKTKAFKEWRNQTARD
jgi:hypothetical protein